MINTVTLQSMSKILSSWAKCEWTYSAEIGSMRLVSNSKNSLPFLVNPFTELPYARKILSFTIPMEPPRTIFWIFGPGKDLNDNCNSPFFMPVQEGRNNFIYLFIFRLIILVSIVTLISKHLFLKTNCDVKVSFDIHRDITVIIRIINRYNIKL